MITRANTIDEMIEVLQACKEGKTIEYVIISNEEDCFTEINLLQLLCNFKTYFYRVKREPAKIYRVAEHYFFVTKTAAVKYCTQRNISTSSIKEFIEVIPDES